ncbi:MAG: glycosyltransferase family 9 protein [Candidatus Hydrogenedentes bacterium]|nr:glycosyltransferase family 9 protein [Candidatus Hydrogenedentota bacterium]
MRILWVHAGGVGDFILSCPALECLAAEHTVEVAGLLERASLAVAGGLAARAHSLDATGFGSLWGTASARLRGFVSGFDRAVVWMRDDDGMIASGLRDCGVKEATCFPGLPPGNWPRHASEYYLERLGHARHAPFRLRVPPAPGQDVVIHPGSGSPNKNWPRERFQQLSESLTAQGRRVAWCLGPAEEALAPPEQCPSLRGLPLVELARVLAGARLYVGNDSGITHLAAAAGCPTIAIFGPTDPRVWAPRGEHVRVLQGPPWPDTEEVLQESSAVLAAIPFMGA